MSALKSLEALLATSFQIQEDKDKALNWCLVRPVIAVVYPHRTICSQALKGFLGVANCVGTISSQWFTLRYNPGVHMRVLFFIVADRPQRLQGFMQQQNRVQSFESGDTCSSIVPDMVSLCIT